MIQLNLLPDVKLQYLKTQRIKRMVILASFGVTAASAAAVVFLCFMVFVWDKITIDNLTGDIKKYNSQLGDLNELSKALTIQYQLKSLKDLHDKKPMLSRTTDMLNRIVPVDVSLSEIKVDTDKKTMDITGSAKSLERANTFADTLKFAFYTVPGSDQRKTAFSDVNLKSVNFGGKDATLKLSLKYDAAIFDRSKEAVVDIEKDKVTTRAVVEKPDPLFIKPAEGATQ